MNEKWFELIEYQLCRIADQLERLTEQHQKNNIDPAIGHSLTDIQNKIEGYKK